MRALIVIALLALAACDERPCLRHEEQLVVTYPYMGFLALGAAYSAIALVPVYQRQQVCVERAP